MKLWGLDHDFITKMGLKCYSLCFPSTHFKSNVCNKICIEKCNKPRCSIEPCAWCAIREGSSRVQGRSWAVPSVRRQGSRGSYCRHPHFSLDSVVQLSMHLHGHVHCTRRYSHSFGGCPLAGFRPARWLNLQLAEALATTCEQLHR